MGETTTTFDRRGFGRRRSSIHAYVLIAGRPASPCVLRNFSEQGALLELSERLEPPFNIELSLTTGGDRIACEVRHVRKFSMGVRFLGPEATEWIARALGLAKRRIRRKSKQAPSVEIVVPARATGQELRRTVLKLLP